MVMGISAGASAAPASTLGGGLSTSLLNPVPQAQWVTLGWPSLAEWQAQGSPSIPYTEWKAQNPAPLASAGALAQTQKPAGSNIAAGAAAATTTAVPTPSATPSPAPLMAEAQTGLLSPPFEPPPAPTLNIQAGAQALPPPMAPTGPSVGLPTTQSLLNPLPKPKTVLDILAEEDPEILTTFVQQAQADMAAGVSPEQAGQSLLAKAQESLTGSATSLYPFNMDFNATNPLDWLNAANALPLTAGQALRTVAEPATSQLPGPLADIAGETLELAPQFLMPAGRAGALPNFLKTPTPLAALGLAGASATGGEVAEQVGLPRPVGMLAGPAIGPGLLNIARTGAGAAVSRLRPEAITVDSVMDQLRAGAAPESMIEQIRRLGPSNRMDLSLRVGQEYGRDAMRDFGALVNRVDVADARAGQDLVADFQRFKATYEAALRPAATEMAGRLEELKGAITSSFVGNQPPGAAPRSRPGTAKPTPTPPARVPKSADDIAKIAQEEKYLRGQGTASIPQPQQPRTSFWNEAMGVLGLPRTWMTGGDVGAILRQGQRLGWSNPKEWADAAKQGLEAFTSVDAALKARAAVESNPWYEFFRDVGGKIYDYGDGIAAGERVPGFDALNTSWISEQAQKIPWLKVGERAHATTLNAQGMAVFEKYANGMWQAGIRDKKQYQDLATVINHARGYGTGDITGALSALNVFFSARNMNSLWQSMLDPVTKSGSLFQPSARQLAAKNLAAMLTGQTALLAMLGTAGAITGKWSVNANPLESDFGKIKMGNTYLDTMGGYGPIIRLVSRMSAEASDATMGTDLMPEWQDWRRDLVTFFRNKLGPVPGEIASVIVGEDFKGDPYSLGPEKLADMFLPMIVSTAIETVRGNEGAEKALVGLVAPAEFVGVGSSTYEQMPSGGDSLSQARWLQEHGGDESDKMRPWWTAGFDDTWKTVQEFAASPDAGPTLKMAAGYSELSDFLDDVASQAEADGLGPEDTQEFVAWAEDKLNDEVKAASGGDEISDIAQSLRRVVIQQNPEIYDAVINYYVEHNYTIPKWLKELGVKVGAR